MTRGDGPSARFPCAMKRASARRASLRRASLRRALPRRALPRRALPKAREKRALRASSGKGLLVFDGGEWDHDPSLIIPNPNFIAIAS